VNNTYIHTTAVINKFYGVGNGTVHISVCQGIHL